MSRKSKKTKTSQKKPQKERKEKKEKKENEGKPEKKERKEKKEKPHLKPEKKERKEKNNNAGEKQFINLDNVNSFSIVNHPSEHKLSESTDYILSVCETNADKYKVYFTSGEVESNMVILYSAINAYKKIRKTKPHLIISSTEHPSITVTANSLLDSDQIELTVIKPNAYGCILSDLILKALKPNTCLVSITYINHELGSVNNISKIGEILHEKHIPLHSNCTYIFGKHKIDLGKTNIDAATISFDKLNGPPGIGALIIRNDFFNGYKLGEHFAVNPINMAGVAASVDVLKTALNNRKPKNMKLLKFRNLIIEKLGEKAQTITFANFMKSDAPPLEETKKSKNKLVILGPPPDNESYYTPSILSFIITTPENKTGADIQEELKKKNIIIGLPNIEGIPKESQPFIVRIALSDENTEDDIDKFIQEFPIL